VTVATLAILALLSYLIGSIPTAYLMGRAVKGIDIREHGSGNPGATNVFRVVGKAAGSATLAIDALKGYLPVFLAKHYFPSSPVVAVAAGLAAIAGHNWTVFLNFKGGKGVATSAGVFLALTPVPALIALGCFLASFLISGHVSVGSLFAAASFPPTMWFTTHSVPLTAVGTFCAVLVIALHKKNIRRLLNKEEPKAIRRNDPGVRGEQP
jgi:glycerol-3-phosphate acyltransferase PlsY